MIALFKYIDRINSSIGRGLFSLIFLSGSFCLVEAQQPVSDPVPSILWGDLHVRLTDWVMLPKTSFSKPYARINMLREMPVDSAFLAVNDLNGKLYIIKDSSRVFEYLDVQKHFSEFQYTKGKGSGLGGFAFHPEFEQNGIFFTTHSEVPDDKEADFKAAEHNGIDVQWVLTKWIASDPTATRFSGTWSEMIRWDFPKLIHGVQEIAFNPFSEPGDTDYGFLYICIGEGGSGLNRFHDNMQTPESHLGTIWRIDPLGDNSRIGTYGVPQDNPFINGEYDLPEIWAYGFRNPHRLHFEKRAGETILFTGDIGELNIEEINIVRKGMNYGWDNREGTFLFDIELSRETLYKLPEEEERDYVYPVAQYDHDDGLAINLGHVWHSDRVPEFEGIMFMGDIPTGRIFYAPADSLIEGRQYPLKRAILHNSLNEEMELSEIVDHGRVDIKFGFDSRGEVYFLSKANGTIYKIDVPGETVIDTTNTVVLEALEQVEIRVYPSFVEAQFHIDTKQPVIFSIIDLNGAVLMPQKRIVGERILDLRSLKTGLYLAIFELNGSRYQYRFYKN